MDHIEPTYTAHQANIPARNPCPSITPVVPTRIGFSPHTMRYSSVSVEHHLPPQGSLSSPTTRITYFDIGVRFGGRLRELRRSANMTQIDMAVAFGIDRSYISDVECGKKGISLATLEIVAIGFKTTLSDLLRDL